MPKARPGTVAELTEFYELGARSLREHPTSLPRRSFADLPAGERARARSEAERLLKARTFADPRKGYSRAEFRALVARCQARGFVLGTSLVARLLGVPKGPARDALVAAAIAGRWTWSQLADAIRASGKTTRHPRQGRAVRRPNTLREALAMLSGDAAIFQKRAAVILSSSRLTDLPRAVESHLKAAAKEMAKLGRSVARHAK